MATQKRRTVAITGAGGYLAQRLIASLDANDSVDRVVGFDIRLPETKSEKLVFDEIDIRNPNLAKRLANVDVLVHLAFIMDPIRDEALMREVNVNGSQNVFKSAAEAGVKKIVYTSSAVVYGAHPDNDVPLTEKSHLRANLDFNYPAHKLEVEYIAREFRKEHPDITLTVFRPAIVFGPNVDSAWSHLLEFPVALGIRGFSPLFQFVHEDDVEAALEFAIEHDLDGAYNLAAEGWLEAEEAYEILGRRRVDMSEHGAYALLGRLWNWGLAEAPAGMLHYVMHPWVVSTEKLTKAGFIPTHDNASILRETAALSAGYIRLGRKRVKRKELAAAAAGLGLVSAVAVARGARSRN